MSKISAYTALTTPATNDLAVVVDVSDPNMAPTGTTKQITLTNLLSLGTQLDSTPTDIQPTGNQAAGTSSLAARADHVHPLLPGQFQPSDSGWLSWAFDPGTMAGGFASVSGTIYLIRVNFRATTSVSNVVLFLGTQGATLTAGDSFAGLYAGQTSGGFTAGQRIGVTADQSTAWSTAGNANTFQSIAMTGAPFTIPVGFCWVAICSTGTTPPTWGRAGNFNNVAANSNLGVSGARFATNGTGTSLPSSITPASNTFLQQAVWAAVA